MCGLNGYRSRNEMTNLSVCTPTFLWGKRLLDLDRYLLKKNSTLSLNKGRVELMSINSQKKSLRSLAGHVEHPQEGGIKGLRHPLKCINLQQ